MPQNRERPTVLIYYYQANDLLREIEAGLEEEGIPSKNFKQETADVVQLGYEAACASLLGVGIGINGDKICVHHQRRPSGEPLFVLTGNNKGGYRCLGHNAGRLVKNTPFKTYKE